MSRSIRPALLSAACFALVIGVIGPTAGPSLAQEAFFDVRSRQTQYAGPGREVPEPADVDEVLIGYFGPSDPSDPQAGGIWLAAQLAVEDANSRGGYRGKPFRLTPAWSENPWGAGVAQLARMAYAEKVWAIVGGIDGPSTHLAEQVVAKARLPLVNPASTDKTVNLANIPWMFSCTPADDLLAALLVAEIRARVATKSFVLTTANDHDSHCLATELQHGFNEQRMAPRFHFEFQRGTRDVDQLTAHILGSQADALVVVAGAEDSARVVAAVRAGGFSGTIFGGPAMGRRLFLDRAGAAGEGALFPLLYDPQATPPALAASFQARRRAPPDYAEAHAYDAVGLAAAAIGKAGLNRARIGDALRELSPWTGVTGKMTWDALGRNQRDVALGTIRDGRLVHVAGPRVPGESTPR